MSIEPLALAKILYFDDEGEGKYGAALANKWTDYELVMKNIRMGCKRNVEALIDLGCRINKPGRYGVPLSMVVRNGWTKLAMKMLDNGARVSDSSRCDDSPLRCAFFKRKSSDATLSLVDAMLDQHLLVTKTDFLHVDGLGFFHIACAMGELKHVKDFLQGGRVNVNGRVADFASMYAGYSALHFAVAFERNDVVELLLKHGANVCLQDVAGSTALHLAFHRRNWQAVERLLSAERKKKDVTDNTGLAHFMIACSVADSLQAEQYLRKIRRSHGATGPSTLISKQVTARSMKSTHPYAGYTPLHFAATFGRVDTVQVLLSYHANCCATDSDWLTPAMLALKNNHRLVCRVLQRHCHRAAGICASENLDNIGASSNEDSGYNSPNTSDSSVN